MGTKRNEYDNGLKPNEIARATKHGIFTVTSETGHGYYVTCLMLDKSIKSAPPIRLGQSKEYVRSSTTRRHATRLVREALRGRP